MKDYLQPAATFALALAIASLPFSMPQGVKAYGDSMQVWTSSKLPLQVKVVSGCR